MMILCATLFSACATMSVRKDDGTVVEFSGGARGATQILGAVDEQPYDLAAQAVERGMSASVSTDNARVNVGHSYTSSGGVVVVGGRGGVPMVPVSSLPVLGRRMSRGTLPPLAPAAAEYNPDAKCPESGRPTTSSEADACLRDADVYLDGRISP
ncbi:hypothetical protein HOI18_05285 [Candidatus Uhrbacteria bacterium]|jgi:hypothetical protein|nr:hypothetical protein [Candidatus Uhrbacteria bacterium]